jgi:hypothetical protein
MKKIDNLLFKRCVNLWVNRHSPPADIKSTITRLFKQNQRSVTEMLLRMETKCKSICITVFCNQSPIPAHLPHD